MFDLFVILITILLGFIMTVIIGFVAHSVTKHFQKSVFIWFKNRYLYKMDNGKRVPYFDEATVMVSAEGNRAGIFVDDERAMFLLHYLFEVRVKERLVNNSKKQYVPPSVVSVITYAVLFAEIVLLCVLFLIWIFSQLSVILIALIAMVSWLGLIIMAFFLLVLAYWHQDFVRHYNGAIMMTQGKSFGVELDFSFWRFLTFDWPLITVHDVRPERATQTPFSTDPENISKGKIRTNQLIERLINIFLTPNHIIARSLTFLAADFGALIFSAEIRKMLRIIESAGERNLDIAKFAENASKSKHSRYMEERARGATKAEAEKISGFHINMIEEYEGPLQEVYIFDLMDPEYSLQSVAVSKYYA